MSLVRPARLRHRLQAAGHFLVVVGGWALFFWMWWLVYMQSRKADDFWWLLLVAFVAMPLVTLYWVMHNKGIYRRLGPRRSVRAVTEAYSRDFHDRQVEADWSVLGNARFVRIDLAAQRKVFRPMSSVEAMRDSRTSVATETTTTAPSARS